MSVGNYSFDSCTSLANVSIPSSVTGIGVRAFNQCSALKDIDIPASVTNIETGAFGNSGLTSVDIPASVTTVETQAFYKCTSLEIVVFQGAVGSMDLVAFDGCSSWEDEYC